MKKLTFCVFSANDEGDVQTPVSLCIKSLLVQDTDESCVIFFDCSAPNKIFNLPTHPDLKVVYRPTTQKHEWNRSVIRNEIALEATTPIICQICADCYYSPNFASNLIKQMGDGNKLLLCCRRRAEQADYNKIVKDNKYVFELAPKLPLDTPAACGECQCMLREEFIKIGGYYKLIKDNVCMKGDWRRTAGKDDTHLLFCIRKERCYKNETHQIKEQWVHDDKDVWIVHLWHPERTHAKEWNGGSC